MFAHLRSPTMATQQKTLTPQGVNKTPHFHFSEFCAKPQGVTFCRFAPPPPHLISS